MVRYNNTSKEAAEYAKSNPKLDVGLHLDFGEWTLKNDEWVPLYEVVPIENINEIKKEAGRQLELFCKMIGKNPTHLDSHQHTHLRENILPVIQTMSEELKIPLRRSGTLIRYCGNFYGQTYDCKPDHTQISPGSLKNILLQLQPGITELACHPAENIDIDTLYSLERLTELKTLCDPIISDFLSSNNYQLASFSEIKEYLST
jgi:predicted glycoside hydrolase/deacetylase ChbG (UPF0249 family)